MKTNAEFNTIYPSRSDFSTQDGILDGSDAQNAYKTTVANYAAAVKRLTDQLQTMKMQLALAERAINNLRIGQPIPGIAKVEGDLPAQEEIRKP